MASVQSIDELDRDPHTISLLLDAAFNHIPHSHLLRDLLNLYRFTLVGKGGISGDHKNAVGFGEAVDDPSASPSLKYSNSFSPLIFVKGSTAIEGLSGRGKANFSFEATSILGGGGGIGLVTFQVMEVPPFLWERLLSRGVRLLVPFQFGNCDFLL